MLFVITFLSFHTEKIQNLFQLQILCQSLKWTLRGISHFPLLIPSDPFGRSGLEDHDWTVGLGIDFLDWMSRTTVDDTLCTPTYPFKALLASALARMSQQMSHLCRLALEEGGSGQMAQFLRPLLRTNAAHNFQPFCPKPGNWDANVFFRRQSATFILFILQKKLELFWYKFSHYSLDES